MNPQHVLFLPNAQADIFLYDKSNFLHASWVDSKTSNGIHSFVKLPTFFMLCCFLHNSLKEWNIFSLWVHHSRFSILLSSLIPFLWLIHVLFSGFGMYVKATSLCTVFGVLCLSLYIFANTYPYVLKDNLKNLHFFQFLGWLHIIPSCVAAYNHSYQGISSILKQLKNSVRNAVTATSRTLSSVCCNIREYYIYNPSYA